MTPLTTDDGGGSFRELRERHLPLFDPVVHRHDRGWPHEPHQGRKDRPAESQENRPKSRWKRVGIVHFPVHQDED